MNMQGSLYNPPIESTKIINSADYQGDFITEAIFTPNKSFILTDVLFKRMSTGVSIDTPIIRIVKESISLTENFDSASLVDDLFLLHPLKMILPYPIIDPGVSIQAEKLSGSNADYLFKIILKGFYL